MTVVVDTSALAKLFLEEAESGAVRRVLSELKREGKELIISTMGVVEMRRLAIRCGGAADDVGSILRQFRILTLTEVVLELAGRFAAPHLGTLDAIHLATAISVEASSIVTYDRRLAEAAATERMPVLQPV